MRILHFSDIHVGIGLREVPLSSWFGKRAIGGLNLLLGRQRHFEDARVKLAELARFKQQHEVDLVICTGDYTALGLEREFAAARQAVEPLMDAPRGYLNVPGNHDLYARDVVREGRFERYFQDTLATDLPEYRAGATWPQVRLFDEGLAVIAVNSARPNLPWRSNGLVPPPQLEALRAALDDSRVRQRHVLVLTHYAPCLPDGSPDRPLHGMVNVADFLAACGAIDRGGILCGHVHHRFEVRLPQVRIPVYCGGSATYRGREGFWLFELGGDQLRARPGHWDGQRYRV